MILLHHTRKIHFISHKQSLTLKRKVIIYGLLSLRKSILFIWVRKSRGQLNNYCLNHLQHLARNVYNYEKLVDKTQQKRCGRAKKWKRRILGKKRRRMRAIKSMWPNTLMDRMPSPFIPAGVVDLVLSSVLRAKSLAWKSPKVPLEEMVTLRFSIPFSGFIAVLKYRIKYTITLPGLKAKVKTKGNK